MSFSVITDEFDAMFKTREGFGFAELANAQPVGSGMVFTGSMYPPGSAPITGVGTIVQTPQNTTAEVRIPTAVAVTDLSTVQSSSAVNVTTGTVQALPSNNSLTNNSVAVLSGPFDWFYTTDANGLKTLNMMKVLIILIAIAAGVYWYNDKQKQSVAQLQPIPQGQFVSVR